MTTDGDGKPLAGTLQMSRRALFRFLPNRVREERCVDGVDEAGVERAPVAVPFADLKAHGTRQIDELLERLERRSSEPQTQPATTVAATASRSKRAIDNTGE